MRNTFIDVTEENQLLHSRKTTKSHDILSEELTRLRKVKLELSPQIPQSLLHKIRTKYIGSYIKFPALFELRDQQVQIYKKCKLHMTYAPSTGHHQHSYFACTYLLVWTKALDIKTFNLGEAVWVYIKIFKKKTQLGPEISILLSIAK